MQMRLRAALVDRVQHAADASYTKVVLESIVPVAPADPEHPHARGDYARIWVELTHLHDEEAAPFVRGHEYTLTIE